MSTFAYPNSRGFLRENTAWVIEASVGLDDAATQVAVLAMMKKHHIVSVDLEDNSALVRINEGPAYTIQNYITIIRSEIHTGATKPIRPGTWFI
jgi:hypothetical protein